MKLEKYAVFFALFFIALSTTSAVTLSEIAWKQFPMKNDWQLSKGMKGGEGMQYYFDVDWNEKTASTIYTVTDTTRVWKSTDWGYSWKSISNTLPVKGGASILSDSNNAEVVYLAGARMHETVLTSDEEGIYRTTDGGNTWTLVQPRINYNRRLAGKLFAIDSKTYDSGKKRSLVIFAGTPDGVLKSTDGGDTWKQVALDGHDIYSLSWTGPNRYNLFVSTNKGLYKFFGGNSTVVKIGSGISSQIYDVAANMKDTSIVYAATASGPYRSTDSGNSFRLIANGVDTSKTYRSIVVGRTNPNKIYLAPHLHAGHYPYYSDDGGNTWKKPTVALDEGLSMDWYYGSTISISPENDNVAITAMDGPMAKTTDGGVTWHYSGNGLTGGRVVDIAFPSQNTMLFCLYDYGVFLTENSGSSFKDLTLMRSYDAQTCGSADMYGDKIIASSGGWEVQDIVMSTDKGKTWKKVKTAGEKFDFIRFNPNNRNIVYADNWVSRDGGNTWTTVSGSYRIKAMNPQNGNTIYGVRNAGQNLWDVAVSYNSGTSWTKLGQTIQTSKVWDVAVDPFDSNHILAAGGWDGVFEYKGGSWTQRADSNGLPRDASNFDVVRFDPKYKNVAWVAKEGYKHHGTGIYVTTDGGATWKNVLNNLGPYNDIFNIEINPFDNKIYITGPGVWYIDFKEVCLDCKPEQPNTQIQACALTDRTWREDTVLANAYDLSSCFTDPLGQKLTYRITGNRSIIAGINQDTGIVRLSSPKDWNGYEEVTFTAHIGNRSAATNKIRLTVTPVADCGDSVCESGETCSSCQQDCGTCPPPEEEKKPAKKRSGGGGGGGSTSTPVIVINKTEDKNAQEPDLNETQQVVIVEGPGPESPEGQTENTIFPEDSEGEGDSLAEELSNITGQVAAGVKKSSGIAPFMLLVMVVLGAALYVKPDMIESFKGIDFSGINLKNINLKGMDFNSLGTSLKSINFGFIRSLSIDSLKGLRLLPAGKGEQKIIDQWNGYFRQLEKEGKSLKQIKSTLIKEQGYDGAFVDLLLSIYQENKLKWLGSDVIEEWHSYFSECLKNGLSLDRIKEYLVLDRGYDHSLVEELIFNFEKKRLGWREED